MSEWLLAGKVTYVGSRLLLFRQENLTKWILLPLSPLRPNLLREILEGWNRNNNLHGSFEVANRLINKNISQDKLNSTLCRYILDSNILYNYYTLIFVEPISTVIPLNIWRLICTKLDEGWFQPSLASAFKNIY